MAEVERKAEVEIDPEAAMESPRAEGEETPVPPAWKEVYGGSRFEFKSLFPPFTWLPAYIRFAKGGEMGFCSCVDGLVRCCGMPKQTIWGLCRKCYHRRHGSNGRIAVLHQRRSHCRPWPLGMRTEQLMILFELESRYSKYTTVLIYKINSTYSTIL